MSIFIALFVVALPLTALAAKGDLVSVEQGMPKTSPPLYITLGKAELIALPGDVSDVLVADPEIVDVMAVKSNRLYAVGLSAGDTNLIVLDSNGDVLKRIDLHVRYDLQAIQSLVEELFPDEDVKVSSIHDQILLTGTVSTPEKASKITNIVGHYVSDLQDQKGTPDELISNLLEVRGEQQVMLQVKIVEASRSILKELGVETNFNNPDQVTTTFFGQRPGSSNDGASTPTNPAQALFNAGAGIALSQDPVGAVGLLFDSGIAGIGTVGAFLNALEEENLVNILAEPNLTAISGQQAGFLAGGEFPVPVGRDQIGNIVIEFREFGVSLNFRPIVMSDKRINLQMNTEVSSLDFSNAIVLSDLVVPGLDVRRAETTVEIPSGGSLMIAGLLQSSAIKGMAGLPGIRNTPILGDLVSSDSFKREETELVVIVTPYLVEPYAEEKRADPMDVPVQKNNPLANAFAINIRRSYEVDEEGEEEMFAGDNRYGYLLD